MKLIACRTEEFDLDLGKVQRNAEGRYDLAEWRGGSSTLYEYTFDLDSGATEEARGRRPCPVSHAHLLRISTEQFIQRLKISVVWRLTSSCLSAPPPQRVLTPLPEGVTGMDFPRIHPALTGKPFKYCFTATLTGPITTGAAKVDVTTGAIVGRIEFPAGHFGSGASSLALKSLASAWRRNCCACRAGRPALLTLCFLVLLCCLGDPMSGDPVFVPAKGAQSPWSAWQRGTKAVEGAEDEGFLLTYVNNESGGNTTEVRSLAEDLLSPCRLTLATSSFCVNCVS